MFNRGVQIFVAVFGLLLSIASVYITAPALWRLILLLAGISLVVAVVGAYASDVIEGHKRKSAAAEQRASLAEREILVLRQMDELGVRSGGPYAVHPEPEYQAAFEALAVRGFLIRSPDGRFRSAPFTQAASASTYRRSLYS